MIALAAFLSLVGPTDGQWTLKDDTQVSLAFFQPSQKMAWKPDTSLIESNVIARNLPEHMFDKETGLVLVAWIHPVNKLQNQPNVRFKLPMTDQLDASVTWLTKDEKRWIGALVAPKGQPSQQDIAVGIADGPWKVIGTATYAKSKIGIRQVKKDGALTKLDITQRTPPVKTDFEKPSIAVTDPAAEGVQSNALRFVVLDHGGKELTASGFVKRLTPKVVTEYYFQGSLQDVARIELQSRPFEWRTVKAAHFRPK
ncbi:MAG: hypothetical protein P4L46_23495 [Fimbriimonas sp.]|nr:hypothetical protein [Fimbriimonas sp.]